MAEAREIEGCSCGKVGEYYLIRCKATLALRGNVHDALLKWSQLNLPNSDGAKAAQLVARAIFLAGAVLAQGLAETPESDWPDASEVQIIG